MSIPNSHRIIIDVFRSNSVLALPLILFAAMFANQVFVRAHQCGSHRSSWYYKGFSNKRPKEKGQNECDGDRFDCLTDRLNRSLLSLRSCIGVTYSKKPGKVSVCIKGSIKIGQERVRSPQADLP